ncbi:protein transport protein Sec16A-like isoform X3 [Asterias rubens]|uniref:protein transport protein Sec16A-like isoform X3 n=1 Tax=Asterias rubens TaxID=7604 RepID=UPI0014553B8E|nr:protein transport protein Sec16A-like isoform X3 [Asterias rubens]
MSGGDSNQITNQGGFYNQGPTQDGPPAHCGQAPDAGQGWYNQQTNSQATFFNPTEYQKTQPAVFNPYNPGEPPPNMGIPQEGQQGVDGQQPQMGYPAATQEPQQGYAQPIQNDQYPNNQWNNVPSDNNGEPPPNMGIPQEGQQGVDGQQPQMGYPAATQEPQQGYAQPIQNDQYPNNQWNNVPSDNNGSYQQQQWGQQPLNGTHQSNMNNVNPNSWSGAPVPDSGNNAQQMAPQIGLYQPYENSQQPQMGNPGLAITDYNDDNDSHRGFGSFFHDDDSDFLGSSGTPSLSASQRQTPDPVLNDHSSVDTELHQQEATSSQPQVLDNTGVHIHGNPDGTQPGGDFEQPATNQQTHMSNQPDVYNQPGVEVPQEPSGDLGPSIQPVNQPYNAYDSPPVRISPQTISPAFGGAPNLESGSSVEYSQSSDSHGHGQSQSQDGVYLYNKPESNFQSMRNDPTLVPSPTSDQEPPFGSSDQIAQPNLSLQGPPSYRDDQISNHSQINSPFLGESGSLHSQPPSASTSRSNSMLGDHVGSEHPSLSPAFQDQRQGSLKEDSQSLDVHATSQDETSRTPDTTVAQGFLNPTSIDQNSNSAPSPDSYPQNSDTVQQAQSNVYLPLAAEQPTSQHLALDDPQLGQGGQHQQPHSLGQGANSQKRQSPNETPTVQDRPLSNPRTTNPTMDTSVHGEEPQQSRPGSGFSAGLPPLGLPKPQPTIPQGPKELSPTDEKTPLTHPSAFRSVQRSQQPLMTSVNPSPPLWSAEVPPMPANILLAPAAPSSAALVLPVRLSTPQANPVPGLAASVASVSVPSLPSEAVSLLTQQPAVNPTTQSSLGPQSSLGLPVASSFSQTPSTETSTTQITSTQNSSNSLLAQPAFFPVQPSLSVPLANRTADSIQLAASAPTLTPPVAVTQAAPATLPQQSVPVSNAHIPSSQTPGPAVGASVAPNHAPAVQQQQPIQHQQQQPIQQQQQQQLNTGVDSQQQQLPLQNQQQQQQQHQSFQQPGQSFNQAPDQQGQMQQGQPQNSQWGDRRSSDPYYNRQQYDPRYQYADYRNQQYDNYGRYAAAYDQQSGYGYRGSAAYDARRSYSRQGYGNQERPRSRQGQGYAEGERTRDGERPRSRQGYQDPSRQGAYPEQESRPRSKSRQGYDQYYKGYDRKDPRAQDYYKGYDAYGRPYDRQTQEYWAKKGYYINQSYDQRSNRSYDDRSNRSYDDRSNRSYDERYQNWERQHQYYRERTDDDNRQNTSAPEQQWPADTRSGQADQSDTGFSSGFHHQGGDTPEKYNADQSSIYSGDYTDQAKNSSVAATTYQDQYGNSYNYGYSSDSSYQEVKQATPPPPERMTPAKFTLPHVIARFSPGGHLIKVLPNMPLEGMPASVEIHSVETMLEHTPETEEMRAFPGPLIRGETHKGDVLRFSQQKSAACSESTEMMDRESAALLWELMVLLCRQNGSIMETDISELLLKNHPMVSSSITPPDPKTEEDAAAGEETSIEGQSSEVVVQKKPHLRDVEADTSRFRELLLFGRKKDALEAAIKAGLWGHALLLACKMDSRTHTSVMTRFANSLTMNDPLQTLYQLMSERQPAAVTSCADEKWGDWRPHLAMILSNLSPDSELDSKSIVTLGDSLASRGLLKASHFVYLMAQVGLGVYGSKTTKMVMIGASHSLPFQNFALNSNIQQTEVYEYAQLLANKHYSLPNYQPYKFIYATRLAEHGFTTQALHYCEVVAKAVLYMPSLYSSTLVNQICQLSDRLVYHDDQYYDGQVLINPEWLSKLTDILRQMNDGQIQPSSTSGTPIPWSESYSNLSTMGESVGSSGPTFEVDPAHVNEGGEPYASVGDYALTTSGYYHQEPSTSDVTTDLSQNQHSAYSYDQQQQQQQHEQQQQQQQHQQQQQQQHMAQGDPALTQNSGNYTTFGQQPLSSVPRNVDPGASLNSNFSEYSTTSATSAGDSGTELEESRASRAAFDYYGTSTRTSSFSQYGQKAPGPPSPAHTLTPPHTPSGRARTYSTDSTKHLQREDPKPEPKQEIKEKPKEKPKAKQGGGRGWFGGFFSKVTGRGNQVHLPDDNNKKIQWDPKTKRWINEDEDEEYVAPPPAPPKDTDLKPAVPTPQGGGSQTSGPSTGPPAFGENKFRKPARRNYVDVVGQSSGASVSKASMPPPSTLFQSLPSGPPSTSMNFFVPGQAAAGDETPNPGQQQHVANPSSRSETPATPATPHSDTSPQQQQQFFNPNAFTANNGNYNEAPASQPQYPQQQQSQYQQQQQQQPDPQKQSQYQQQQLPDPQYQANNSQLAPPQTRNEENRTWKDYRSTTQVEDKSSARQQPQAAQPPPTQAAGPVFFNPQTFPNQLGGPSMPPSAPSGGGPSSARRGYGTRRQYPTAR